LSQTVIHKSLLASQLKQFNEFDSAATSLNTVTHVRFSSLVAEYSHVLNNFRFSFRSRE